MTAKSEEEHHLYEYYGIDWGAAWQRSNQPGEGGWTRTGADTNHTDTEADTRGPADLPGTPRRGPRGR